LGLTEGLRRFTHLLYIGTNLARMHVSSYVASTINTVLWFSIVFVPTTLFSPNPLKALHVFLPGTIGFTAAATGMWVATEFLRWYVHEGLTDMFRECGLNVFHYLVCGFHIDLITLTLVSYLAVTSLATTYLGVPITHVLPTNPLLFALAFILAVPAYLLCGALIAYLYTVTPVGGAWTNLIQMVLIVGTIVPPKVLPNPELALINPAVLASELARASYGANFIPVNTLLVLATPLALTYLALAYIISKYCDKYIAKYGIRFRR